MSTANPPPAPAGPPSKKGKNKKGTDARDASEQIAAKIAQLELDAAGERDYDAEIEREVKKANRELSQLLSQIESPMKRVDEVRRKYTTLLADMKRTEREHVKAKKRADQLQKEKDAGKTELNRMTTMKEKLEKMSRDLTKENKKLKEENAQRQETESRHREELHSRLDRMVTDVDEVVNSKENSESKQVDVDLDKAFQEKFKSFMDLKECQEKQFRSLMRVRELEVIYHQVKLDRQRKAQELESSKSNQLTRQVTTFSQTEAELRSQLNIYVEKFKQDMTKKTKRLEKENQILTRKQEATNKNILEMAEERQRNHAELQRLRTKNDNLEKLCRSMQAQGRGQMPSQELDAEDDGTESEYLDDDEYDEEGSEEYDEDTEEEAIDLRQGPEQAKVYGPPPPPPQAMVNGKANCKANGQPNGVRKN
ncbi:myosin-like coiled-coil protein-domain-containing protein [Phyllosticta citricarpa]